MTQDTLTQESLSLKTAAFVTVIISAVIAAAVGIAIFFNKYRQNKVIDQYTWETEQFINNDHIAISTLFNQTFADCQAEVDFFRENYPDQTHCDISCAAAKNQLNDYFFYDQPINFWQDFLYYIPGKEVIVPVEVDGETIGYIFRGVIEKQ